MYYSFCVFSYIFILLMIWGRFRERTGIRGLSVANDGFATGQKSGFSYDKRYWQHDEQVQ